MHFIIDSYGNRRERLATENCMKNVNFCMVTLWFLSVFICILTDSARKMLILKRLNRAYNRMNSFWSQFNVFLACGQRLNSN